MSLPSTTKKLNNCHQSATLKQKCGGYYCLHLFIPVINKSSDQPPSLLHMGPVWENLVQLGKQTLCDCKKETQCEKECV